MIWEEYLKLSEKTLSKEFHCGSKTENLLHAVMGILTEIEELLNNHINGNFDSVNVLEETSDIMWYMAIISREFNIKLPILHHSSNIDPEKIVMGIIIESLKLLDILKKKIFYNKEIDDDQFISISNLIMVKILDYMKLYDIDINKSFDVNISKLKERYGDKFTSERAINRNLENERQILEK